MILLESVPVDSAMALAPPLGVQSKSGGLWDPEPLWVGCLPVYLPGAFSVNVP